MARGKMCRSSRRAGITRSARLLCKSQHGHGALSIEDAGRRPASRRLAGIEVATIQHGSAAAARRKGSGVMIRAFALTSGTILLVFMLAGCAALPLAALGGAALESGAGAVVKTGTEYTMGGTAHRTFTIPQNAVRAAVLEAFDRAGVTVKEEDQKDDDARIAGQLNKRSVRVRLTPLSASLTEMTLVVKRNLLAK